MDFVFFVHWVEERRIDIRCQSWTRVSYLGTRSLFVAAAVTSNTDCMHERNAAIGVADKGFLV